jgi:hypothetical protein
VATVFITLRALWERSTGRPVWNEWTARLFTAVISLWIAQRITLRWGWSPLVEQTLRIVFTANAALLVGDPVVGVVQRLSNAEMIQITTDSDRGEQHG